MKKYLIILSFWICTIWAYGQNQSSDIVFPDYPGGFQALKGYLFNHFRDNYQIDINSIHDTLYIEFIIEADGSATGIHFMNEVPTEIQGALKETIEHMPKWQPGKNGAGIPSRFKFVLTM
ncbi:MAG: hypothetical protein H7259_09345 [Cytophagales bacterium]|nr:hypothetical protein [Cytophaga sp.]